MATTRHMTAQEFSQLPDDGRVLELIDGIVVEVEPTPGIQHGYVMLRVGRLLGNHVEEQGLGVVLAGDPGFVLRRDPDEVRGPDVAFIAGEPADQVPHTRGYWSGAPDLVIEVLSPSNTVSELEEKALKWLAAGAQAVLLLAPLPRTATVLRPTAAPVRLTADDVVDLDDVVAGWRPRVDDLLG